MTNATGGKARAKQGGHVLAGQMATEGLSVGAAEGAGLGGVAHRRADCDELEMLAGLALGSPFESHPDYFRQPEERRPQPACATWHSSAPGRSPRSA